MRVIHPAEELDRGATYQLLNALVSPRPIAWVSTVSSAGVANLAPHSYFTIASVVPPTIAFTSIGTKDTLRNIAETSSFVVNIVDHAHAEAMNVTAINAPYGVDEFAFAGVPTAPSTTVAAPRVADAPAALECVLDRIIPVGDEPAHLILGVVTCVHVAQRLHDERDRIDPDALDAIARMGGSGYCTTRDRFSMRRPSWDERETSPGSTT